MDLSLDGTGSGGEGKKNHHCTCRELNPGRPAPSLVSKPHRKTSDGWERNVTRCVYTFHVKSQYKGQVILKICPKHHIIKGKGKVVTMLSEHDAKKAYWGVEV
jgi:hypothetical protein